MKRGVWILNHHANDTFFDEGGRHYSFAKYLKRAGYAPTVFCSNAEHGTGRQYFAGLGTAQLHMAEKIGVPFIFIKGRGYKGNGLKRILCMFDYYVNVRKYAGIYAEKNGKPDVIIASSVHPLACVAGIKLARKMKIPCIVEIRDLWPESIVAYRIASPQNVIIKALYRLERWIYTEADAVIFTVGGGKDYIKEKEWDIGHGGKVDLNKVYYINNGVDLEQFDKNRGQFCIEDDDLLDGKRFKVVYAGSLRKVNNLGLLLDAAKLVKNEKVIFLIWGGGDEQETLKARVEAEHIGNVRFKGTVGKQYIPYIAGKADINFLHNDSSPIFKYGLSMNKLFDYLAAGKPILTDLISPYNPAVQCGAAVEVKVPIAENIAEAVDKMAGLTPEELGRLGANAREGAKNNDFKKLTEQLEAVIRNI